MQCRGDTGGRPHRPGKASAGLRRGAAGRRAPWPHARAATHSQKRVSPHHGIVRPWWQVAVPWPASLVEGMPHISGPRSANLVNLRAASRTCQLGVAAAACGVSAAVRLSQVWGCLSWLLSPQPLPVRSVSTASLESFRELSESQRTCHCHVWEPRASLTAVRARTPRSKVYETSSFPSPFGAGLQRGTRPTLSFLPASATQMRVALRFQGNFVRGTGISAYRVFAVQAPVVGLCSGTGELSRS